MDSSTKRDCLLPSGCRDLNQMVRVIGQDRKQLGVFTVFEATKIANNQAAELVMIAPNAKSPICRVVDWLKFRREMAKRRRKHLT